MKRVIIIFIVLLATTAAAANAQFFVEGSVGASYWGGTYSFDGTDKDNISSHSLTVSPLAGYCLNEKLALGVSASLIRKTESYFSVFPNGDVVLGKSKSSGWSLDVLGRYKLSGWKKFSFLVESSVYMSKLAYEDKSESTTTRNETRSSIGVKVLPLISNDLSGRFSIVASSDFLSLNLYYSDIYYMDRERDAEIKTGYWHFEFAGQSAIVNSLSNIKIGVIYHFKNSGK